MRNLDNEEIIDMVKKTPPQMHTCDERNMLIEALNMFLVYQAGDVKCEPNDLDFVFAKWILGKDK